ncbi:MAG: T9SS type A sorting domain-containing protein [Anaerotruncus sp.]|nr:T9SS type A sorting domain-containing protein [Anaerotruncus sp.]
MCLDYAFTYARDPNKDHTGNLEILNYLSGEVKKHYNNLSFGCKCPETSVNYQNTNFDFTIYPSIVETDVWIEFPFSSNGDYSLQLINTSGQVIYNTSISNFGGIEKLNLSTLEMGIYMLRISGESSLGVKRS